MRNQKASRPPETRTQSGRAASGTTTAIKAAPRSQRLRRSSQRRSSSTADTPLPELDNLARRIRVCTRCPLHASRTIAVPGEGKSTARVMIVGEGPGKQEDKTGRPFVGSAGRYLEHVIGGTGFERTDFFITNIVKCRPPANRAPKMNEVDTCTSLYLFEQIRLINPGLIVLLGGVAAKKMLGARTVEEVRGRIIEKDGRKYLASYHPAVRFYREDLAQKIKEDFALLRRELSRL
jgi:uracil-DNA glycosylase family 4